QACACPRLPSSGTARARMSFACATAASSASPSARVPSATARSRSWPASPRAKSSSCGRRRASRTATPSRRADRRFPGGSSDYKPTANKLRRPTAAAPGHGWENWMTQETLVRLRGVAKDYRRAAETVHVLQALDLDIARGDFLALMGPSGSGKSTLLNLIGGLDRPSTGQIEVDGQRIDTLSDAALARWRADHVGFVFQMYNLLPVLSAERNVELPLLLTRLNGAERRARAQAALKLVGLSDRAKHKPRELSGGQEQRVGIARAIVSDPTLLLCDEPTGDLDRQSGDEILDLLQALNERHGKTIVMVTHDPHAAARAKRTLHLTKGQLSVTPEAA